MNFKRDLMACSALLGMWFLVPASATAQSMSETEEIQKLERQTTFSFDHFVGADQERAFSLLSRVDDSS